jgi:TolA-binding protein
MEGLVLAQLKRQIERLKALDLLEDEDEIEEEEDEEEERPKTRRGKAKAEAAEEEDEEEDEEEEEDEDEPEDEEEESDDEEESEDDGEDEDEEEEEDETPDEIKAGVFEVVKVNRRDEIFDLNSDDYGDVKMWLGDGIEVDYDVIKKGVQVVLDAAQDEEGDLIITAIKQKPKRGRPAKRK